MRLVIKSGRVIDPANDMEGIFDILIEGGRIARIEKDIKVTNRKTEPSSVTVINAEGKIVVPGLIDMHCHLREPGYEYKETIATGTKAAAAGGFTTICCMPNTEPVNDNRSVTDFIITQAKKEGMADVLPIGAITKGRKGEELAEIGELVEAGCIAISDDGSPVMNSGIIRIGLEYAKAFGIPVISHCEDRNLSAEGVMNEGLVSTELGLLGIPSVSEEVMVARDLLLAELTKGRIHIAHVSTIGSVRLIREAKERGIKVTAETCPHYFTLTEEEVRGYNTNAKVNPPLRTHRDVEAIKIGLKDGTIDIITTDHAPHAVQEKEVEFNFAPFGIVGLETALPLCLRLVEEGVLTLKDVIAKLTTNPAKILGLKKGSLAVGSEADITIIDIEKSLVIDPDLFRSKGKNSPFAGWKVKGAVITTIVGGKVVYQLGV